MIRAAHPAQCPHHPSNPRRDRPLRRYLFVTIDRCSHCVHLTVKDDETEKSAMASLRKAAAVFPVQLTHVLTDSGSCLIPANAQRQRVLEGKTLNQVVVDYLKAKPDLANPAPHSRIGPCDTTKIRLIADTAEKVSQPDTVHILRVRHAASDTEWRQPFPQHKVEHGPEPR